jgi:hypothetical protein
LGISQALASNHRHQNGEAIRVRDFVVPRRPIVETKHLLVDVVVKVKWLNRNIGTTKCSFQEAPEVLDSLSVNFAVHILVK